MNKEGFTLIDLMTVVAIVGILASVVVSSVTKKMRPGVSVNQPLQERHLTLDCTERTN